MGSSSTPKKEPVKPKSSVGEKTVSATFYSFADVTVTVTEALVLCPPTRRPRVHHRVNPYPGARRQNETKTRMFSDHDETSPSIAAVSAPSVACSMLCDSMVI